MSIWRGELIEGRGSEAEFLLPEGQRQVLERRLREIAASDDLMWEWPASQADRDQAHRIRANQRTLASAVRQDVAAFVRESPSGPKEAAVFAKFRDPHFLVAGRHLMSLVDPEHHNALASRWSQDPAKYPFFSAFLEGCLYANYYAAFERNKRIDLNAQADYEQLGYLTCSDVFVSNDTQFLRDAFDTIWRPRGKRLETAESFAHLIAI